MNIHINFIKANQQKCWKRSSVDEWKMWCTDTMENYTAIKGDEVGARSFIKRTLKMLC